MRAPAAGAPGARRVAVVTGSRADYGLLRPVMRALAGRKDARLQVVVTGMHLRPEFGRTVDQVRADGWRVDAEVPMVPADDSPAEAARSVGEGVVGLVDAFERLGPDVVLVLGDRFEVLAAAIAAAYGGRVLAHVHGGDRSQGGLDEYTRHAVTKMAHLHFAATKQSAARIRSLGERPETVHVVGAPGLDEVLAMQPVPTTACAKHGVEPGRYLLVVFHPVSTDPEQVGQETRTVLEAALATGLPAVALFPNSDPGSAAVLAELQAGRAQGKLTAWPTLPREEYLGLLAHAAAILGNSSSGIIEAPALGVPAVNVGPRQRGRERGENVLDAPAERAALTRAVEKALGDSAFRARAAQRRHPYGDGKAGARIAEALATLPLTPELRRKEFHDEA